MRGSWRTAIAALLLALVASPAYAQGVARSLSQLRVLVEGGSRITVIDGSGGEWSGRLGELTSSELLLQLDGRAQRFHERDIARIRQRRSDSLANGALWGLGVGVGFTAMVMAGVAHDYDVNLGSALLATGVYGGLGAGIGVGVDALIRTSTTIYESSASQPDAAARTLSRERRRIAIRLVTIRF
ncbi:MAG TPA: hypothetical protein VIK60_08180 [Vicinamibacterales bacterium]